MSGRLTEKVKRKSKELLDHEITLRELRLIPYLDHVMKNTKKIDVGKINAEEMDLLGQWVDKGWIMGGVSEKGRPKQSDDEKIVITKKFYNAMQEILWISYVEYEAVEAEDAFTCALIADKNNNYQLAMQQAERAVALMPDKRNYLDLAGMIAEKLDEHDKAIDYYEQTLNSDLANFGEDYPTLDIIRKNIDRVIKKRDQANRAIEERIAGAKAAYQRAQIAEENDDYPLAMQHVERAVELVPNEGHYLNLAGTIAEKLGDCDKAIDYYEQALSSDLVTPEEDHPVVPIIHNNLGALWESKGEYGKAIGHYVNAALSALSPYEEDPLQAVRARKNIDRATKKRDEDKAKKTSQFKPQ